MHRQKRSSAANWHSRLTVRSPRSASSATAPETAPPPTRWQGSFYPMLRALIAAVVVLSASSAQARTWRWSKIDEAWAFRGWRGALHHVVDTNGGTQLNHFCLVVQTITPDRGSADLTQPPDVTVAHVLWREGHEVLEWEGVDPEGHMQSIPGGEALDFRKDFQPTIEDLHGSTYQETFGWLRSVRRHCLMEGTSVTIRRDERTR